MDSLTYLFMGNKQFTLLVNIRTPLNSHCSFIYYPHLMHITKDIVLSCVCDFFLFLLFSFVTTITLERLKQSGPNFHTFFDWNSSARFEDGHQRSRGLVFIYIVHAYRTPDSTTACVSWLSSAANRRAITLLVGQLSFISWAVGR